MLTLSTVRARIAEIRACAGDNEAAHSAEDDLREDVLRAIADGHQQARMLAQLALSTKGIKFDRWCA